MKKNVFIAAIIAIVITSCNNSKDSGSTAGASTNSANDQALADNARVYKAIETGDMTGIDTLLTKDAVDHDAGNGKELVGRDSIIHMLSQIHTQIKDLKLDVVSSATNGDYMFTLVHVTGTTADSSHTAIDSKGVDVLKMKDGKMSDHWGFTEDQEMSKRMMEMQSKMGGKK